MAYINWEYYSSLFSNIPESAFTRLDTKAESKIDVITHMRVKKFMDNYVEATATDFQNMVADAIKITICEMINCINDIELSAMGTGVTSVSNDGYAESYKITTKSDLDAEMRSLVMAGLSGTGLAGTL